MKDRILGSGRVSTIVGSVLGAAVAGAANYYQASGGNVSSWQGYAAAAGFAVAGALWKPRNRRR